MKVCLKENIRNSIKNQEKDSLIDCLEINSAIFDHFHNPSQEKFKEIKDKIRISLEFFKKIKRKREKAIELSDELKIFDLVMGIMKLGIHMHYNEKTFGFDDNALIVEIVDLIVFSIELLEKTTKFCKLSLIVLEAILASFQ